MCQTLAPPMLPLECASLGYIAMLRARMFRSLIPVLMIKERNIHARNITIDVTQVCPPCSTKSLREALPSETGKCLKCLF